ncbi:hypothetical protein BLOT_013936 [Blomia tropicalis]|nr:hypothetical protein BLOT_013936 [Blomia tropicalis]
MEMVKDIIAFGHLVANIGCQLWTLLIPVNETNINYSIQKSFLDVNQLFHQVPEEIMERGNKHNHGYGHNGTCLYSISIMTSFLIIDYRNSSMKRSRFGCQPHTKLSIVYVDENGVKSKFGSELCHFVEHSTNDILWSIIIGLSFGNIPINCSLGIKLSIFIQH